jgi:outer membrane protein assembly factor BamE (lipoprotein component of BamABCDE complex)
MIMSFPTGRLSLALVLAGAMLAGCTSIADHQGYVLDEPLITAIQPGVDNRDSVLGTLGRPTFVGQFDERDWYYVARETRQLAFNMPKPHDNDVIHIRFDQAGNVERVDRTGMELVVRINPSSEETPTLGRERSLLEELFGNIGAVGQTGRGGQTTDNPN